MAKYKEGWLYELRINCTAYRYIFEKGFQKCINKYGNNGIFSFNIWKMISNPWHKCIILCTVNAVRNLNMLKLSALLFHFECKNKNHFWKWVCGRFRILIQSGIFLWWILNMFKFKELSKPQMKFHYSHALIFFGYWIRSHFLRKRDGFKEMCNVFCC